MLRCDIGNGGSIEGNGWCLAFGAWDEAGGGAELSTGTLGLATLGTRPEGAPVNFERAQRASDRLGGHPVAGHVDPVGSVASVHDDGPSQRCRLRAPASLLRYVAVKGSIAVDGVSLTVNAVDADGFEVNLVPHTIAHTAFAATNVGDAVNLEADTVARYVERLLGRESR